MNIKQSFEKKKEWIVKKLNDFFREKSYIHISERKSFILVDVSLLLAGIIYHHYKTKQEWLRIFIYNLRDDFGSFQILYEIVYHSRKLIYLLALTTLVSSALYIGTYNGNFSLTLELVKNLLLAYFAGITALMGIIFAFYSVGFQISTSKFSSEVTDYVNQEQVGKFFFKLLVFSGIISLIVLIIQYTVSTVLILPFFIITALIIISILGILIYKDDYITKLKPKSIFQRLHNDNNKAIREVNQFHIPSIRSFSLTRNKNISSFKLFLPTRQSWSIVATQQKNVEKRLSIHFSLFKDLMRENAIEDASYGVIHLGYFLVEYIAIKHYIDIDMGWWFPTYQEIVTSKDISLYAIKANYEAQGIGRMGTTKKSESWLEDEILRILDEIQNNAEYMKNPIIANALIYTYETILAGRFEKTNLGMEKTIKGIFERQDFELTERVTKQFLALAEKLPTEGVRGNYINSLGQIKTVLTDGFTLRSFPGKKVQWQPKFKSQISSLLSKEKTTVNKEKIIEWDLPKYFYMLLTEYLEMLQAEEYAEGKVITPSGWLVEELDKLATTKENEIVNRFIEMLLDGIFTLWKNTTDSSQKTNYCLIIFALFNQLISSDEWEFLEKIITKYKRELSLAFASIDTDRFIELEFREPIDFGVFNALVRRNKVIFIFYARLFFLAQLHINHKVDRANAEELLKSARRPLMLAALAYLVSELDEDFQYVIEVTRLVEPLYPLVDLATLFETTKEMKVGLGYSTNFRIIWEESNRYRGYYREVINSIADLPEDWISHGGGMFAIGSTKTVKHKSPFIRKMASFEFSDMDECVDGYVEWLQNREQIKKLINILKYKK